MLFTTKEHPIASISVLSRNSAIEGIPLFDMGFSFFWTLESCQKYFYSIVGINVWKSPQNEDAEHSLST